MVPSMTHRFSSSVILSGIVLTVFCVLANAAADEQRRPFAIRVVDQETGRGVPLIELRTVNQLRYVTDSAGYVAFFEPGLMDSKVHFAISGHGYEAAADGFGYGGGHHRGCLLLVSDGA